MSPFPLCTMHEGGTPSLSRAARLRRTQSSALSPSLRSRSTCSHFRCEMSCFFRFLFIGVRSGLTCGRGCVCRSTGAPTPHGRREKHRVSMPPSSGSMAWPAQAGRLPWARRPLTMPALPSRTAPDAHRRRSYCRFQHRHPLTLFAGSSSRRRGLVGVILCRLVKRCRLLPVIASFIQHEAVFFRLAPRPLSRDGQADAALLLVKGAHIGGGRVLHLAEGEPRIGSPGSQPMETRCTASCASDRG